MAETLWSRLRISPTFMSYGLGRRFVLRQVRAVHCVLRDEDLWPGAAAPRIVIVKIVSTKASRHLLNSGITGNSINESSRALVLENAAELVESRAIQTWRQYKRAPLFEFRGPVI